MGENLYAKGRILQYVMSLEDIYLTWNRQKYNRIEWKMGVMEHWDFQ